MITAAMCTTTPSAAAMIRYVIAALPFALLADGDRDQQKP